MFVIEISAWTGHRTGFHISSSPKGVLKKEDRFVKIRCGCAGAGVIQVRGFYLDALFVVALLHQEAFLNVLP
jgi:hypothetical protein